VRACVVKGDSTTAGLYASLCQQGRGSQFGAEELRPYAIPPLSDTEFGIVAVRRRGVTKVYDTASPRWASRSRFGGAANSFPARAFRLPENRLIDRLALIRGLTTRVRASLECSPSRSDVNQRHSIGPVFSGADPDSVASVQENVRLPLSFPCPAGEADVACPEALVQVGLSPNLPHGHSRAELSVLDDDAGLAGPRAGH